MTHTNAKHLSSVSTVTMAAPPEQVFPLLCPVREYDWIDGWTCELVHSSSGVVEEGCIFVTDHPPEGRTIWVTVVHDPAARRVEFVRVTPASHVSRLALTVAGDGAGGSRLEVRHDFTALDERGGAVLAGLEGSGAVAERWAWLGRALDHFVRTGTPLRRGAAGPG